MKFKISNLKKPSNKIFKRIADTLLYTLPLYLGAVIQLEMKPVAKMWIIFVLTITIITLKGITKFTAEDEAVVNNKTITENETVVE